MGSILSPIALGELASGAVEVVTEAASGALKVIGLLDSLFDWAKEQGDAFPPPIPAGNNRFVPKVTYGYAVGVAGVEFGGLFGAQSNEQALVGERRLLVASGPTGIALRSGASRAPWLARVTARPAAVYSRWATLPPSTGSAASAGAPDARGTLSTMTDPHAQDREQLIRILREVEASINAQSLDGMVQQMDPNATVVWANGEVSRGPAEIFAYYDRMVKGKDRILKRYTTKATLSGPARFLADGTVAIADGSMEDEFTPTFRGPFKLQSRWSTTIAKMDGQWKVVGLHLSANVFNNVLLDEAKRALMMTGGGGLAVGVFLGWLLGHLLS